MKIADKTRWSSWTAVAVTPLSKTRAFVHFKSGVALRLPPQSKTPPQMALFPSSA
jgi:hypothetical protein